MTEYIMTGSQYDNMEVNKSIIEAIKDGDILTLSKLLHTHPVITDMIYIAILHEQKEITSYLLKASNQSIESVAYYAAHEGSLDVLKQLYYDGVYVHSNDILYGARTGEQQHVIDWLHGSI